MITMTLFTPYGVPGTTSRGRLQFDRESIRTPDDLSRVKMLTEHAQGGTIVGHAIDLERDGKDPETGDAGLAVTFAVDDDPMALAAVRGAVRKLRDGASVGVELDADVEQTLARNPGVRAGTRASGVLREFSLVAVPAFTTARVIDVTGADDLDATPQTPAATAAGFTIHSTPGDTVSLTTAHAPTLATAGAPRGLLTTANGGQTAPETPQAPAQAASAPAQASQPTQAASAPQAPTQGDAGPLFEQFAAWMGQRQQEQPQEQERPSSGLALFGGSTQTSIDTDVVYTFNGRGPSLVRDLIATRDGDPDAQRRVFQFHRAVDNPDSDQALALAGCVMAADRRDAERLAMLGDLDLATAAVQVRDSSTDHLATDVNRTDLLLRAIDRGRPFTQRIGVQGLDGPDPFRLPTLGQFTGVGDHTEGTAHRTEGTISIGSQTITPTGVSGAYRLSRELVESKGSRLDLLVVPEMVKDYRRNSEARIVATMEVAAGAATLSVDTAAELNDLLIDFGDARDEDPDLIGFGSGSLKHFANLQATDGRPVYPYLGPANVSGTTGKAFRTLDVQGVPGVRAWSAATDDVWIVNTDDLTVFESAPRLFRFEEVEGPGIIKLAIWGYQAAHVFRDEGLVRATTAAA